MSGCALIKYNNRTARIRGEVAQGDKHYIQYALAHWAVIAIRIRNTDHHFTDCRLMSGLKELQNK
jgi:hypothetical protein